MATSMSRAVTYLWYCCRARVERVVSSDPIKPEYEVLFVDYGNRDRAGGSNVRAIEPSLAAIPPQAHQSTLAYLKVRRLATRRMLASVQLYAWTKEGR